MKCSPDIHRRHSLRLKGYDYSQGGLYFITICAQNGLCLFGDIQNEEMILNDAGKMVEHQWQKLLPRFDNIKLHEFVVMPNHFHRIVELVGVPLVGTQSLVGPKNVLQPPIKGQPQGIAPTVGDLVGSFKSLSTNDYIRNIKQNNWQPFEKKLWQRNYYEHIIRNDESYYKISKYVQTNPLKWQNDGYYEQDQQIRH